MYFDVVAQFASRFFEEAIKVRLIINFNREINKLKLIEYPSYLGRSGQAWRKPDGGNKAD